MTLAIRSKNVTFSKVARRLSWNSIRTSLSVEHMFGTNASLSEKNLATGGTDSAVVGAPTFGDRYMTGTTRNRMVTAHMSVADETYVAVAARIASSNNRMMTNIGASATNTRIFEPTATNLVVAVNGANVINQTGMAALTADAPYFFAARFSVAGATLNVKAWYGKAGVLSSFTGTSAAVDVATVEPLSVGGDQPAFGSATRRVHYAAVYSDDMSDANIAQMYADARAHFLAYNSDF